MDDAFAVDMRLCDWNNEVFNDYDALIGSIQLDRNKIVSIVGASGCGKTSSLLRAAASHYVILFGFGSAEINDTNLLLFEQDIASICGGFYINARDHDAYQRHCDIWDRVFNRCRVEILARMLYLVQLKDKYGSDLTPKLFRDSQLNGAQSDIGIAVSLLKSFPLMLLNN